MFAKSNLLCVVTFSGDCTEVTVHGNVFIKTVRLFAQNTGIVFFTKCVQRLNLEQPLSVLC